MDAGFEKDLNDPHFVAAFIKDWNESRLDMFALRLADQEKIVFSGVMRFYFQDRGLKAVTKCIRVSSNQTVRDIMPTLIEKFCPDMKMLSTPNYELYEIHGTGDVQRLTGNVRPLIVQCLWQKEDREGRFVLKSADLKIQPQKFFEVNIDEGQLRRRLSRREKKDLKKKRKEELARRNKSQDTLLADRVYRELPESSLTRTISNPEAVMRRRRQQKLEKRMKEFQNKEGPQTGGILKVFAESLKPEIPYKTILASVKDNADVVTKAALEKFLLLKEDPTEYCIVMAIIPASPGGIAKERTIRSSDCPLAIQNSWPKSKGVITFHLRRKQGLPDKPSKEGKKAADRTKSESGPFKTDKNLPIPKPKPQVAPKPDTRSPVDRDNMPFFLELTPEGKEINYKPKLYYIGLHETIIGSSRNPSPGVQYLQLFSPKILASHCSIVNVDASVSIVPHGPEADVRVNGQRIFDNTILHTGNQVQFGGLHTFRFCNPVEEAESSSVNSNRNSTASVDYQPYKGKGYGSNSQAISPELKELILNEQIGSYVDDEDNNAVETTFGVDGGIETNKSAKKQMWSARSAENLIQAEHHQLRDSFRKHRQSAPDLLNMNTSMYADNLLPASLTFLDQGRDAFFAAIISEVNGAAVNFKLAPTYTLYLAARYILSQEYRPGLDPVDRTKMLNSITKRIASTVQQTIQENDCLAGGLAFWMANASELLHFYRQDVDLGPLTQSAQAILAQSIQESFALLVNAMEEELSLALPAFLDPSDSVDIHPVELDDILNDDLLERAESTDLLNWTNEENDRSFRISMGPKGKPVNGDQWISPAARIRHHGSPVMADILYILSSAMSLLRRCRVNAALTIQLFSQLFHYINMWVFNRIVLEPDLRLCTRLWGHCLSMRISYIEAWAERQGLELAADCHLARVVQAVHLLEAPKETPEEIADLASCCFKLNSLQLRVLLENYLAEDDEPLIPQELIDSIVAVAESTSDELSQDDGYDIKLEEDIQLQLPFLLPEEGYSSDIIRGVPPGLQEFLDPLCDTGLCVLHMNPQCQGIWTIYQEPYNMEDELDNRDSQIVEELPIERITIDKGKGGLGLSICAAKGAQSDFTGIYIKAVIAGGLAEQDGRLEPGDQILKVNEVGMVDVTQTQAAKVMGKSGPVMTLEIIKGAVFYHGLAKLVQEEEESKGNNNYSQQSSIDSGKQQPHKPNVPIVNHEIRRQSYETNIDDDLPPPVNHNQVRPEDEPSESDYDSDGQLLTKEEKERRARQLQRQIEYEERLAKWEAERIQKENEEAHIQQEEEEKLERKYQEEQRISREEEERRVRDDEKRQAKEEEERKLEAEAERRYEEEVQRKRREREAQENAERIKQDEERKRREMEEKRLYEEQRAREEEELSMMEELQKWEAEEELRKEEEKWKREENDRRLRKEEEERKLYEQKERRMREEEERRLYEEKERRMREEEERRLYEEKEKRMREEEERRLYEEKERRMREEEERKLREEEERRLRDDEKRRREVEQRRYEQDLKKRKEYEEEQKKADEERREKLQRLREEERVNREQAERDQEDKRKQEKNRLIEERRRKEENANERERRKHEAEDNRRKEYEQRIEKRKQEQEQMERERIERDERQRKEKEDEKKREEERKLAKGANVAYGRHQLDKEMASIDDALREAERIAAEMDLFMFEEEQKIEADSQMKRKKEEQKWMNDSGSIAQSPTSSASPQQNKVYRIENKPLKRTSSKENILETNLDSVDFLPPATEDLVASDNKDSIGGSKYKYETNIDSSDDEKNSKHQKMRSDRSPTLSHQNWADQQREKREKQRLEQENLKQQKLKHNEEERRKRENEEFAQLEIKRKQQEEEQERLSRNRKFNPPPPVKPKFNSVKPSFQVGNVSTPVYSNHRVEYSPNRNSVSVTAKLAQQDVSDDEEAPPRPPPPRSTPRTPPSTGLNSARFNYANNNGYSENHSRSSSNISSGSNDTNPSGLVTRSSGVYNKVTPPRVVVNQGVGEPEVLDFRSKMKLFGKFQS